MTTPSSSQYAFPNASGAEGMTYREWLIGQALTGIAAAHASNENLLVNDAAGMAIKIADRVLDQLRNPSS